VRRWHDFLEQKGRRDETLRGRLSWRDAFLELVVPIPGPGEADGGCSNLSSELTHEHYTTRQGDGTLSVAAQG